MHWLWFAGLASSAFIAFSVMSKMVPTNLSAHVGSVVMLFSAACAAAASYLFFTKPEGAVDWTSYWPFIFIGMAIFGINLGYAMGYAAGGPIGLMPAIVNLSAMVILIGVGAVFFKETLTLTQWAGFALGCVSVYLMTKGATT